ncbi:MAG TPA: hotdog domain-containing protein [Verrucomicrobiae bacterium]|nr:hotdog domain-containing protein [Verrucomicrobiae bacterium]
MSKMELPYTRGCFVCGAQNQHGLRLRFRRVGNEVHADFTPQPQHAGFRGIVHGGILSTVLDEAMFWAAATTKKGFCLAAELNVRFITKVSVGQRLLCVARLKTDRGRLWESEGELRDEQGNVCVRGTCKQVPMDVSAMKDAAVDFLPDPSTTDGMRLFADLGLG